MKEKLFFLLLYLFAARISVFAGEIPFEGYGKYTFKFRLLLKVNKAKNFDRPIFGYRLMKTFPLRVKEFTFPARHMEYRNDIIEKKAAPAVIRDIVKWRRKNAYHIANAVYDYINSNIEDRQIVEEPAGSSHLMYYSNVKTFIKKQGNTLEKCRLAVSILRYYTIPARIVCWKDRYVVEYFLRPLKEKNGWFIMDFTGEYDPEKDYIEPVAWYPLDAKELLNEEWKGKNIFLKQIKTDNYYIGGDRAEAKGAFEKLIKNNKYPAAGRETGRKYFSIKEIKYEIWLEQNMSEEAEIIFTMPFNSRDTMKKGLNRGTMKTMDYDLKPVSKALKIKFRRAHTRINPPQRGLVYTLPAEFSAE